jgi:hypothetical protein
MEPFFGGKIIQVKQEAAVVAEIQADRAGGSTLQSIADSLNGRGIPTKTGKTLSGSNQSPRRQEISVDSRNISGVMFLFCFW